MEFPQKAKLYHMIRQLHFWVYIQKQWKTLIGKDICTLMFTALFKIAEIWKPPKCPSRGDWIMNRLRLLLSHEKEQELAMRDSTDGPRGHYAE